MNTPATLVAAREAFHASLFTQVLRVDSAGIPNNADRDSQLSSGIARAILKEIGTAQQGKFSGQALGSQFERVCEQFLNTAFPALEHLRPGPWLIDRTGPQDSQARGIARFDQYEHLVALSAAAVKDASLAAALGTDYIIKPDVMVYRQPFDDSEINVVGLVVDDSVARHTSMRKANQGTPVLHASISCKWTIRSDRSQNSRAEALNLIRNRKGRVPHAVVVTAEPLPSRIASVALGTGDLDCVYHFALPELEAAVEELGNDDSRGLLTTMIEGKRLRDIADLPFDLLA